MASILENGSATYISIVSDGRLIAANRILDGPSREFANCEGSYDDVNKEFQIQETDNDGSSSEITDQNNETIGPCFEKTASDGGLGWMVAFASFMNNFLLNGVIYSFGIFFEDLLEYFGGSKGKTQIISSVTSGTSLLIGPLVGAIARRFRCRRVAIVGAMVASIGLFLSTFSPNLDVMILLYGIVGGTGFGLVYGPSTFIVSYYFNRRRALATGIAVCGSGIGGFVFPLIGVLLLEAYGWKGAMWVISAIVSNGVIFAAVYRPIEMRKKTPLGSTELQGSDPIARKNSMCPSVRQMFRISLLSSPSVVIYAVSCWFVSFGFYIPFNFLPEYAKEKDLSASDGALLLSIIGIFSTLMRVVMGLLADRSWADCILINGVVVGFGGVATIFIPYYNSFAVLAVYSVVFGTAIGTYIPLRSIILIELKGIQELPASFGIISTFCGVSILLGSPLAGFLSDLTDDLSSVFYLGGAAIAFGGILCLPLLRISRWEICKQHQ
ncbi:monocarboxylate transporter 12-like [Ylistrum balloti]|uniref:monocarboxylate transporter 12-like n=1 Tax=Ylistrum balloti TaxID=509963 RepID=UPI002905843F|nr:monocarboxylate transporter 12-like [Ylistrum balloti]